ncbi:hypothetical protein [Vibrio gallaecicus]|nr:hypothetical protein [Vibrio gallaecicus]MDN3616857.1 hypothetical protein [Vibrio gallaecicus]
MTRILLHSPALNKAVLAIQAVLLKILAFTYTPPLILNYYYLPI